MEIEVGSVNIMPKRREFSEEQITEIVEREKTVTKKCEIKRLLILRLRAVDKMKSKDISKIVGYSCATIDNLISQYFKSGILSMIGENRKGGNKRYLTRTEEETVLRPFMEQAEKGEMLIISDIRTEYEKKVGFEVPMSTIYRMLARQGWRKIMPRSKHPKSKPEEFEAYKKNQR